MTGIVHSEFACAISNSQQLSQTDIISFVLWVKKLMSKNLLWRSSDSWKRNEQHLQLTTLVTIFIRSSYSWYYYIIFRVKMRKNRERKIMRSSHTHIHAFGMCVCVCVCVYIYAYMHMCVCVCTHLISSNWMPGGSVSYALTPDFWSGYDLRVARSSPTSSPVLGSTPGMEPA